MSKMRQKSGKGSFRGVPFLIEDEQGMDGGRRLVRYEYPLRDDGRFRPTPTQLPHQLLSDW